MLLILSKDTNLILKINQKNKGKTNKKFKKYNLNFRIESKHFNYGIFLKIKHEELISIIENVENMLFCNYRSSRDIELNGIRFEFDEFDTKIKVVIKICENQEYAINLDRKHVINIYNYLTKNINTLNKVKMIDFTKKYTYVEVRYVDLYTTRRYSYITEDRSTNVGDIVLVDRAGKRCLAVVESKSDYYYENAPYPILGTKRVLKTVVKVGKYRD